MTENLAQHYLDQAQRHYQRGEVEAAITALRLAIKQQQGRFPKAYFLLGKALYDAGEIEKAIAAFRTATEQQPHYPEAYYHLGLALARRGELEEAIAAYERAIEQMGGTIPALITIWVSRCSARVRSSARSKPSEKPSRSEAASSRERISI